METDGRDHQTGELGVLPPEGAGGDGAKAEEGERDERSSFTFFIRPADEEGTICAYTLRDGTKYWAMASSLEALKVDAYALISGFEDGPKSGTYDLCFRFMDHYRCSLTRDMYPGVRHWTPDYTDDEVMEKLRGV